MFNHANQEIDINQYGQFTARVNGQTLISETLGGIKAKIDAELKAEIAATKAKTNLPIIAITGHGVSAGIRHLTITGIHRVQRTFLTTPSFGDDIEYALPDTADNAVLLNRYLIARRVENKLRNEIGKRRLNSGYGIISAEDYAQKISELELQYQTASKIEPFQDGERE